MRQDLMIIVAFEKHFVFIIYNALEARFEDNHIISIFKMLGPINMPSKQVVLVNWEWLIWNCYVVNMELSIKLEEEIYFHW